MDFDTVMRAAAEKDNFYNILNAAVKFNSKYYHWNDLIYHVPDNMDAEDLWSIMKLLRRSSLQSFKLGKLEMQSTMTPDFQEITHDIDLRMPVFFNLIL